MAFKFGVLVSFGRSACLLRVTYDINVFSHNGWFEDV